MAAPSRNNFTIKDVARLAGVSIATASAVINNKGTTSERMKKKVEDAMSGLDYRPDNMARSLKTGKSKVVGMLIPDVSNPFFTEAMCGVEETARTRGYSVILSHSNESTHQEIENLGVLRSQRVDGVILGCASGNMDYERATRNRFPIVFIDRIPYDGFSGRAVLVDNVAAAYAATRHLLEIGHRKIALMNGRTDISVGRDRVAGFRKAMKEAQVSVNDAFVHEGSFTRENGYLNSGYNAANELMSLPDRPTAVFSCNNSMTLGLMKALAEKGISCPRDVSIVTFDDYPWESYFQPKLTAVSQPAREMGRRAMWMMLSILEPDSPGAEDFTRPMDILSAELRVRQSTAPI
ncbi:MAG TPA: LacI family DNA-binding transcriptional regulator [Opitutaceae bacterium]|jgi:LacI family transcriptional regulator